MTLRKLLGFLLPRNISIFVLVTNSSFENFCTISGKVLGITGISTTFSLLL